MPFGNWLRVHFQFSPCFPKGIFRFKNRRVLYFHVDNTLLFLPNALYHQFSANRPSKGSHFLGAVKPSYFSSFLNNHCIIYRTRPVSLVLPSEIYRCYIRPSPFYSFLTCASVNASILFHTGYYISIGVGNVQFGLKTSIWPAFWDTDERGNTPHVRSFPSVT